jgi:four helix bundle protein
MSRQAARSFQDLEVWQRAHALTLTLYRLSETFPRHEQFGLTNQTRRASVSIAANIAEGFRKRSTNDKVRFYNIAQGSLEEVRYYLILIADLHYAEIGALLKEVDEIGKLLDRYINAIRSTNS